MRTKQVLKSKQTKGKLSHTVHLFFRVGSNFWQPWAFNGVSLCICQLLCSSGALTHCGSLSDQINVAFLCNAATSETHHRHSYTLRKPQQPLYKHTSIIPHCRLPSKCQRTWNQTEETKNTKASCNFFSSWVKCQNKKLFVCLVVVWDALSMLLWLTHFSELRLR